MSGKKIAHMVYFTLVDDSESKVQSLIDDMKHYLDDHPGLEYFGCGTLNKDLDRPVNDREFHVSLHTIFQDRAAHDQYQSNPRHIEFIERNKANWKNVRVFDSDI